MNKIEKEAIFKLSKLERFGYKHLCSGLDKYKTAQNLLTLEQNNWDKLFPKISRTNIYDKSANESYIALGEQNYPKIMSEINSPPLVLFYRGKISILSNKLISIVGTRNYTSYGERITKIVVKALGKEGYGFVSGMALGIDTIVHETALEEGFPTVAVIPSSLREPEPYRNRKLALEISRKGLLISEYDRKRKWNRGVYAKRNRIIAGLSSSTIVIEAPIKSGALITANLAFDYNRDVYAFPGSVYSVRSAGCNWLIKMHKAQLLDLSDLKSFYHEVTNQNLNYEEKEVMELLEAESLSIDELKNYVSITPQKLQKVLLKLELKQLICLNSIGKYIMNSI